MSNFFKRIWCHLFHQNWWVPTKNGRPAATGSKHWRSCSICRWKLLD